MSRSEYYNTGEKDTMGRPVYRKNSHKNKTISQDKNYLNIKDDFDSEPDLDNWDDDCEEESLDDLLSEFDDYDGLDIDDDSNFDDFSDDFTEEDLDKRNDDNISMDSISLSMRDL